MCVYLFGFLPKVIDMKIPELLAQYKFSMLLLGFSFISINQGAKAQEAVPVPVFMEAAGLWLNEVVSNLPATTKTPLRMVLVLGELDSRLRLAPCNRIEPYVPVGTRLWGKTRIGLRCLDGVTKWNVFLPLTVRAMGPAWVVKGLVSAGATLTEADAMEAEVDWAESPSPIVSKPSQWVGAIASGTLAAGQTLRLVSIKPAQVFQAGAQVRVLAQGPGFTITSDGQALSPGVVGQLTQIKMENGRVLPVVVVDSRTVKLDI